MTNPSSHSFSALQRARLIQSRGVAWILILIVSFFSLRLMAVVPVIPPGNTNEVVLDSWTFEDTNYWTTGLGYSPISFTNLSVSFNGPGNSLLVDTTNTAWLQYNVFEMSGATNINIESDGSAVFWFFPSWASTSNTNKTGSGPGVAGRLIEVGTTNGAAGWWSLFLDSGGNNLYFSAQDGLGNFTNYLAAPITFDSNSWHLMALAWTSTNTTLYVDGAFATNGPGLSVLPPANALTNGFTIGSDLATGTLQMHGAMNNLTTYNYPVDANTVETIWTLAGVFYSAEGAIAQAPSTPEMSPAFNAIAGPGYLSVVSSNSGCGNNTNVWLTNPTSVMTNGAANITFTIAGGSNGLPYDVFATPALGQPLTNATWTWMGQGYQCCTYTIPSLTNSDVFLVLGTPQDSFGNGLTDAYELLVLHQNPANGSQSGDGMLDGWKVLWGMNPLINNAAQPSARANYTYDGTGRLEENSGVSYSGFSQELFGFDAEGNIFTDQP